MIAKSYRRGRLWTPEDEQFVTDNIATLTIAEIAERIDRSPQAIRNLLQRLGVRLGYVRNANNVPPTHEPTREEIVAATAKIRAGWSERERDSRLANDHEREGNRAPMPPEFIAVRKPGKTPEYLPV